MTDKKQQAEKKIKTPIEGEFKLEITDESAVKFGSMKNIKTIPRIEKNFSFSIVNQEDLSKNYSADICINSEKVFHKNELYITLSSMRNDYKNGKSTKEILNHLVQDIITHKDDSLYIIKTLSNIAGGLSDNYDSQKRHYYQGSTAEEILEKILSLEEGEELNGFVCMNIHELVAKIIDRCGMNAVIFSGKMYKNEKHATLLYQLEDGKFVYTNYNNAMYLEAPNIKEAALMIYHNSADLESFGYIKFLDDNCSYQEYALKDEAVWGRELDKRDYNRENPLNFKLDSNSGVKALYNISTAGNMSAEIKGTLGYSNSIKERETSLSLGYKKTQNTSCFDKATSLGLKIEHKGIDKKHNSETFFGLKFVADDTKGELPGREFTYLSQEDCDMWNNYVYREIEALNFQGLSNENVDKINTLASQILCISADNYNNIRHGYTSEHITSFLKGEAGKKTTLFSNKNVELNNAYKCSLIGGLDYGTTEKASVGGDVRILLEDGFGIANKIGKSELKNNISFGAIADQKYTGGAQKGGVQIGTKLNGETSFTTLLSKNTVFGVNGQAYTTVTKPATELGTEINIFGTHKPNASKVTFYGNISAGLEKQNLRIGGFDNLTENVRTIGMSAGAQISKNVSIGVGYNGYFDLINNTKNRSTFNVSAIVNLSR